MFRLTIFFPHRTAGQHHRGGRGALFTTEQEEAICTMVVENNAIRLREIKRAIREDNNIFENIQTVSISTIDRVLKRHQMNTVHCWCQKCWKSEGAALPVCTGKTCMRMQQLYLTVNSTTSYSDIQYSKSDLYTFALVVEKMMQYVLYTFDVTLCCPKWKCMEFIKLILSFLDIA